LASEQPAYKITVNESVFYFTKEELDKTDIIRLSENNYHVVRPAHAVKAYVKENVPGGKSFTVETSGESFTVDIKDALDQSLEKMGYGAGADRQVQDIKAPMPGLVLDIAVSVGQEVQAGDRIVILEAMKMENSILVQGNARIKKVSVKPGQAVEKGQVLVELE